MIHTHAYHHQNEATEMNLTIESDWIIWIYTRIMSTIHRKKKKYHYNPYSMIIMMIDINIEVSR